MKKNRFQRNPESLRKRTNLTLDPAVWAAAQDLCYSRGISVSEMVNQLLREMLADDQNGRSGGGRRD